MKIFKRETVKSYMTEWLTTVKQQTVKPSTYDRIEACLTNQVFPKIGDIPLSKLKCEQIQLLLNDTIAEKSYSTTKKIYNNLNNCFSLAVIRGKMKTNPMTGVILPKRKKYTDISSYSLEHIKLIAEEAVRQRPNGNYKYRYGYAILLLLNTGMRLGELLYLKWEDVNFEARYIYIHGNVTQVKSRNGDKMYTLIEQDVPKTDRSTRYISLNDNAIICLKKLRAIINNKTRVIASKTGKALFPKSIHITMQKILNNCNITGCKDIVHALRHTFATMLIRQGIDIKVVSELLGHSDVSTTIRIYYHVIEEQKHSAVHKLDNFY